MTMYKVVMVRHGESEWNKANLFCGWYDADLSELGVEEAKSAGKVLKEKKYEFDIAFTSVLKRAIKTLYFVQDELDLHWIPVVRHWRLNERMYGALQGLNKAETAALHGEEKVKKWRRSYAEPPPKIDITKKMYPGKDDKYKYVDKQLIPRSECLKDTVARVLPYWYDVIVPEILKGQRVLISAHGNSLRALVKYLDNKTETEIMELNIPTGIPLVYELDEELRPIRHYYLGDDAKVKAAMAKVAAQGKAKKSEGADEKSEGADKQSEGVDKKSEGADKDADKKSEGADKKSEGVDKEADKKSEDLDKKSEDADKKSEGADKKSEGEAK